MDSSDLQTCRSFLKERGRSRPTAVLFWFVLRGFLATNMSHKQWRDWVSPDIDYIKACPDLPITPD